MRYQWLVKNGNDRLIVFFNGWGQDAGAVAHLSAGADVLMLYAYHDGTDFEFSTLWEYKDIDIAAWSMGVWYASLLDWEKLKEKLNVRRTVALCGTMQAIDDDLGIPTGVFEATLSGLMPRSLEKFGMRMAGGVADYRKSPLSKAGSRTFEDIRDELVWWKDHFRRPVPGEVVWQKALVGLRDGIFPLENQLKAWVLAGVDTVEKDLPHYPLAEMGSWDEVFDLSNSY